MDRASYVTPSKSESHVRWNAEKGNQISAMDLEIKWSSRCFQPSPARKGHQIPREPANRKYAMK